jgi:hypothetical protein
VQLKFIDTSSKFGVRSFLCPVWENADLSLISWISMVHSRQWRRRSLSWERSRLGIDSLDLDVLCYFSIKYSIFLCIKNKY